MSPREELRVEVSISPELRALYAARKETFRAPVARYVRTNRLFGSVHELSVGGADDNRCIQVDQHVALQTSSTSLGLSQPDTMEARRAFWTPLVLRRDGARPVRFLGQLIVGFTGKVGAGSHTAEQNMRLYLSNEGAVWLALELHSIDALGERPLHQCHEITTDQIDALFVKWAQCVTAFLTNADRAPKLNGLRDIQTSRGAFQTLTGHCFRTSQTPAQRTELCLQ